MSEPAYDKHEVDVLLARYVKEIERLRKLYLDLAESHYETFRMAAILLGTEVGPVPFEESPFGRDCVKAAEAENDSQPEGEHG